MDHYYAQVENLTEEVFLTETRSELERKLRVRQSTFIKNAKALGKIEVTDRKEATVYHPMASELHVA